MAARQPALFQIPLVIILSPPESLRRYHLCDNLLWRIAALRSQRLDLRLRLSLLLRGVEENRGAVLGSPVRPLPVQRSGIMKLEKGIQQLPVTHLFRIEIDLHDLDMRRLPTVRLPVLGADILIAGILLASALISHGSS